MKPKETLEEAAEKLYPDCGNAIRKMAKETFINGAKWQQEQDKKLYNEEEVKEIILDAINSCTDGFILSYRDFDEWFEKNKKTI